MTTERNPISLTLRSKRQLTLPRHISEQLGLRPGDILELEVENSTLVGKPRRQKAMAALKEIQDAFARSGITEKELLKAGRRARRKVVRELYGSNR
ncbi:MAG: AbrB/MazE/SpoVT family DNA-binding domain-containing protein [Chloroflexi bacterium]|nr:AbrB/MazE/SpoVT family DNA-binding domain-containing protein [Chloroflexota bacterium]